MLTHFSLSLMVNHACNLRCTYCYTGAKVHRPMPMELGSRALDRALASLQPEGRLHLGFFGGEPMLEPERIMSWVHEAGAKAHTRHIHLDLNLTTNGTIQNDRVWNLLTLPIMHPAISCDGSAASHDRHRRHPDGRGSADQTHLMIRRLAALGKEFEVVLVVGPDHLTSLPEDLEFLYELGARRFLLSLDLWTTWPPSALEALPQTVTRCAQLWKRWLPDVDMNWFSEKLSRLSGLGAKEPSIRCGFGVGEVAVAPSGRLYPCERLIGEDSPTNPSLLPGHVLEGDDFLNVTEAPGRSDPACDQCCLQAICGTQCRCSNFIRTGHVDQPDGLLCRLEKACYHETVRHVTWAGPDIVTNEPSSDSVPEMQPQ